MKSLEELTRPNIWKLSPYSSARNEYSGQKARVFLDANENPYNQPFNRYPDPLQNELKKCEDRIQTLEERNSAIDEEMALPENCTDIAKLGALQKEKTANEQELETLYEKWEELQM